MVSPPELQRRRVAITTAASLGALFAVSVLAIEFRPAGLDWTAWSPAVGVAVGMASRFPRHRVYPIIGAIVVVAILANVVSGRPLILSVALGLVRGAEAWAGSAILRGSSDRLPSLRDSGGIVRLLYATGATAVIAAVGYGVASFFVFGPESALSAAVSSGPTHASGLLLIAPLFFRRPVAAAPIGRGERVAQWALVTTLVLGVFWLNTGWPLAFLPIGPLVWGAARLRYREFVVQLVLVAIAVARLSARSLGPFAYDALTPQWATVVTNIFFLSTGIVVFTVIALVSAQRRVTVALGRSEELLREAVHGSTMGVAVLEVTAASPTVRGFNPAGAQILGYRLDETIDCHAVFDEASADAVKTGVKALTEGDVTTWSASGLHTTRGPILDVSLVALPDNRERRQFSLQFVDVTERTRVAEIEAQEMRRAAEIQEALLPHTSPDLPGYEVAGRCTSTKAVGGDFFDWYAIPGGLALTLGDVMGKGVGASMIAASVRTAMRVSTSSIDAGSTLERVELAVGDDLAAASTFVTVFHSHLRASDGRLRYSDAGHGLSLIVRADGRADRLDSRGLPLGAIAGSSWTEQIDCVHPGDTLVAFSDGVLDLFDGSLTAIDDVADVVRAASSAQSIVDALTRRAAAIDMVDDVTVLVLRRDM